MSPALSIFILSDGTGETADQMIKAALVQYVREGAKIVRYKNIRSEAQVVAIVEEAHKANAILVYTLVSENLRVFTQKVCDQAVVPALDLLGPLLGLLARHLTRDPKSQPGAFHQVNENYFKRIEAIEFTVKHDDGRFPDNLQQADVVLVGLSRTSKTPLSVYLSYKGWKVANVPVVKDIPPPEDLFKIDQRKIVGLMIDPGTLVRIRQERLIKMGKDLEGPYANPEHVAGEIEYCKELFKKNRRWPVLDVTGKALEETASEVEKIVRNAIPEKFGNSDS